MRKQAGPRPPADKSKNPDGTLAPPTAPTPAHLCPQRCVRSPPARVAIRGFSKSGSVTYLGCRVWGRPHGVMHSRTSRVSPVDRGQLWGSLGENIQGSSQKGTGQRGPFWSPPWLTFKHSSGHEDSVKARAHSQMRLGVCWCPGWGDPSIQRSSAPVIHDVHTEAHMPKGLEQPLQIQLVSPRPGLWRILGLWPRRYFLSSLFSPG